eukprot:CAMPEP_0174264862 /NCGR_PEP_ID=MMETSP0439-20130205/24308_1 /TAXON_ID=0 /ORGANISM="Stereomyxa ramosa, Strain Chinc5" /LENGTH=142 /DNA_ID=CAMNT_0015351005 /DNA_START=496 /DNA_END=921 /DNA_ORIENTATION=+
MDGRLTREWRTYPPMFVPHSLALDPRTQRLFVADRENGKIQVIATTSKRSNPVTYYTSPAWDKVFALDLYKNEDGDTELFMVNWLEDPDAPITSSKGWILDLQGRTLETFGEEYIMKPHDIAVDQSGVYVVDIVSNTVMKFV